MKKIIVVCLLLCIPFGLKAEKSLNVVNLNKSTNSQTDIKTSTSVDTYAVGLLFIGAIAAYLFRRKLLLFRK